MHPARSQKDILKMGVFITILLLSSIFIAAFKTNLHCTQYSSFWIATFDMEPHIEEFNLDFYTWDQAPIVYRQPWAPFSRFYLSASILALLYVPASAAMLTLKNKLNRKILIKITLSLFALVFLNSLIPSAVIGERYQAMNFATLVVSVPMLVLILWFSRPKNFGHEEITLQHNEIKEKNV